MVQNATQSEDSPDAVATRIADAHASAVEFLAMSMAEDAPIGRIARRMVDGQFDKTFLTAEVERFTGVRVDIPENPGTILAVIPQHGYWAAELTLPDQVFRAAGYEVDYVTPRGERPFAFGVSLDTTFRDQAWNAPRSRRAKPHSARATTTRARPKDNG
ncbi:MAG: hypothetical protein HWD60_09390 [Defluviicoccus sp.]|nr:MAG: hypothetical protein HWD60_09390 [Defluviicoccus sp.]